MFDEIRLLQLKQLEILRELDRVCKKKNKLQYFLSYGTLIGAVRHKGFIPWDDDVDIAMPYVDYLKFEEVCKTQLGKNFFLQTSETDPNASLGFNKLRMNGTTLIIDSMKDKDIHHGINIDIQPIYNIPDDKFHRMLQLISALIYWWWVRRVAK